MATDNLRRWAACALLAAAAPALLGATGLRTNFDERVLAAHNRERSAMGVPPLAWNPDLAAGAREWSDHLAKAGRFEHSPDKPDSEPIGENIWGGTPDRFPPEAMIDLWIAEKEQFQAGTFPANSRTGKVEDVSHYTQVVWRSSQEVGCALSRGRQEEVLVCRYSAAGNIVGQLPL